MGTLSFSFLVPQGEKPRQEPLGGGRGSWKAIGSSPRLLPPGWVPGFHRETQEGKPGHGPRCRQPCPARPAPGAPHVFAERAKHRLVGRLVCGAILTPGPRLQFPRSARRWQAANRRKPSLENLAGPQGVCEKQYPGSIPFQIDVLGRGVLAGEVRSGAVIGETRLAEEAGAGLWAPGWA